MLSPQDITIIRGLFLENNTILDKRFEAIDTKFVKLIADLENKFDDRFDWLGRVLKKNFDSIDRRFDAIDLRFERIEAKLDDKQDKDEANAWIFRHDQRISILEDGNRIIKTKLQLE